jgi:hypothetical protein
MKLFRKIKAYIRLKKNQRFLKKHRVTSWKQYNLQNDHDVIYHATLIKQYYHGYPYLCYFERVPPGISNWVAWVRQASEWCEKNCLGKSRWDLHRVIRERGLIRNEYDDTMIWSEIEEFSMNDVGGHDVLFFAFKNEKDLAWFKLRWQ